MVCLKPASMHLLPRSKTITPPAGFQGFNDINRIYMYICIVIQRETSTLDLHRPSGWNLLQCWIHPWENCYRYSWMVELPCSWPPREGREIAPRHIFPTIKGLWLYDPRYNSGIETFCALWPLLWLAGSYRRADQGICQKLSWTIAHCW